MKRKDELGNQYRKNILNSRETTELKQQLSQVEDKTKQEYEEKLSKQKICLNLSLNRKVTKRGVCHIV